MNVYNPAAARHDERRPFECPVTVSWHTRAGEIRSARARCVDLSPQGARIECGQPIEVRTNVYMQAPTHGLMGDASVRYCIRCGLKYMIGLMFSSASSLADQGRKHCLRESEAARKTTIHEN